MAANMSRVVAVAVLLVLSAAAAAMAARGGASIARGFGNHFAYVGARTCAWAEVRLCTCAAYARFVRLCTCAALARSERL